MDLRLEQETAVTARKTEEMRRHQEECRWSGGGEQGKEGEQEKEGEQGARSKEEGGRAEAKGNMMEGT